MGIIENCITYPDFKQSGITRLEIPIVLCWRDNNSEALYKRIVDLRKRYRYQPSREVILSICDELTEGRHNSMKDVTIIQELPDEFIRKMRLTGLITIRCYGAFIDSNRKEIETIEYVINNYSKYKKYDSERDYFDYSSQIDNNLVKVELKYAIDIGDEDIYKFSREYFNNFASIINLMIFTYERNEKSQYFNYCIWK